MVAFRSLRCNIYSRPMNKYIVETPDWIVVFMFHFRKGVTVSGFLSFLVVLFIGVYRDLWFNPACRTTSVENAY